MVNACRQHKGEHLFSVVGIWLGSILRKQRLALLWGAALAVRPPGVTAGVGAACHHYCTGVQTLTGPSLAIPLWRGPLAVCVACPASAVGAQTTCSGWHQMLPTSMGCSGEGILRADLGEGCFALLCWHQKQCLKLVSDLLSLRSDASHQFEPFR